MSLFNLSYWPAARSTVGQSQHGPQGRLAAVCGVVPSRATGHGRAERTLLRERQTDGGPPADWTLLKRQTGQRETDRWDSLGCKSVLTQQKTFTETCLTSLSSETGLWELHRSQQALETTVSCFHGNKNLICGLSPWEQRRERRVSTNVSDPRCRYDNKITSLMITWRQFNAGVHCYRIWTPSFSSPPAGGAEAPGAL